MNGPVLSLWSMGQTHQQRAWAPEGKFFFFCVCVFCFVFVMKLSVDCVITRIFHVHCMCGVDLIKSRLWSECRCAGVVLR